MKRLLDGIAMLIIFFACIFEFIIAFLFPQLVKGETVIELNKTLVYIHVALMILSNAWLFTRAMNNWDRK